MAKQVVFLSALREGYGIDQIRKTMTVGELVNYLQECYSDDTEIYLSHDGGYTYGGVREEMFSDEQIEEEDI
jgi:hypothetical protein